MIDQSLSNHRKMIKCLSSNEKTSKSPIHSSYFINIHGEYLIFHSQWTPLTRDIMVKYMREYPPWILMKWEEIGDDWEFGVWRMPNTPWTLLPISQINHLCVIINSYFSVYSRAKVFIEKNGQVLISNHLPLWWTCNHPLWMIGWPVSLIICVNYGVLIHHIDWDNLSDDEDEYPTIWWINHP